MYNEDIILEEAILLATIKHKGQKRRDGTPYIFHPLEVSKILREQGFGVKYQVIAVLHDILEDTDTSVEELRLFGNDVIEAVLLLTRGDGQDENDYVRKILNNRYASYVKMADKINNLLASQKLSGNESFKKYYANKAKKYYFGKFSKALDNIIENCFKFPSYEDSRTICTTPFFPENDFKLYSE